MEQGKTPDARILLAKRRPMGQSTDLELSHLLTWMGVGVIQEQRHSPGFTPIPSCFIHM